MGKPYSTDLRDRIADHIASGQSRRSASRHFGVSPSCAVKLAQRIATTGSAAPARQGRPPGDGKLAPHMATLMKWVDAEPDITMPELSARLANATGVLAHPASLSRVLLKAGFSFKKNAAGDGVRTR
jgi:transposase